MEDRFGGKVIMPTMPEAFQARLPDRQFEVDSTICVHFTRILTALQGGLKPPDLFGSLLI